MITGFPAADSHTEPLWDGILAADLVIRALSGDPDRPAILMGDAVVTVGELRETVSRYSQLIATLCDHTGTTVALLSTNRPESVAVALANQVAGMAHLGLHPYASVDDHAAVLEESDAKILIVDAPFVDLGGMLRDRLPALEHVLSIGAPNSSDDLAAVAQGFAPTDLQRPAIDSGAPALIGTTGGTTGAPKVVVMPNRVWTYMTMIEMSEWDMPSAPQFLICSPLSHAAQTFVVPALLKGGSLVILPRFDPDAFLEAVARFRVSATMLVPTMIYSLLDHAALDEADISSLEIVYYGASAISPSRLQEAIERMGSIFFQFYGQMEAPMVIATLKREDHALNDLKRLASCGRPVPWLQVALLDDDLRPVETGEPGEICVRGPLVMGGYNQRPDETAEAFRGGWLHTGDVARADTQGYLTIVDRKKDMIISGGFNVYPAEIERVLADHPGVAQAAVIGIPDEKWGEAVLAVIRLRVGAHVSATELRAFVKAKKGSIYAPKHVEFVAEIPATGLGKIDKKALREPYWKSTHRAVN